MVFRRATAADIPSIGKLLLQVHDVHATGRPDIFKKGQRKYSDAELAQILASEAPVFVATDDEGRVLGHAFCLWKCISGADNLCDRRELYIDDICVDENQRGKGVGAFLYEGVHAYAEEQRADAITLSVWCLNEGALHFYEKCGMTPLKVIMEQKLK